MLDIRDRDLDFWDEVGNKTVDAKAKASLQALSETREMNFQYSRGQRPIKKDDKDSKGNVKNKFSQNSSTNASSNGTQSFPAYPKKDQNTCFC